MAKHPGIARVRPDSRVPQLDREFDYRIPAGLDVRAGVRVRIPMGRGARVTTGFVTAVVETSDYGGELQEIEDIVSPVEVLTPELLALATEVAKRHAGGVADVLRLAIPQRAVRVEKAWLDRNHESQVESAGPATISSYSQADREGAITPGARTWCELPYGTVDTPEGGTPQSHREIAQIAAEVLRKGGGVIVAAPDWRDVTFLHEQLVAAVGADYVARFDSDQTSSERYAQYLRCLEGPVIAVGARHAIYAPVVNLALLVVLNDSDDLHREPLSPYPHTRDVALIRAEQSGSALIFASHVPSLSVLRLSQMGFLETLSPRASSRPRLIPTSLTANSDSAGNQARLPSIAYRSIREALATGPVLVQVFRSGYAPGLACSSCRERARCRDCQGPLRSASAEASPRCAWCSLSATNWLCPLCGSHDMRAIGHAVGRTVAELGRAFPGVPVIQADGSHRKLRVGSTPALVVATRGAEPVAQGGYASALLLDGEAMLQRASLTAMTETLDAWEGALALVRSEATCFLTDLDGAVANALASGATTQLLERELGERAVVKLPPAVRLVVFEGGAETVNELVSRMKKKFLSFEQVGHTIGASGTTRFLARVSYSEAVGLAVELRASIVSAAMTTRRGRSGVKVSFDGQSALDDMTALS